MKVPLPTDNSYDETGYSNWFEISQTFKESELPLTAPGSIGPPNCDKSTAEIAVISSWFPVHVPAPTNNSPWFPSESSKPFASNKPISSPSLRLLIVSSKINKVDSPVSFKETLKCWPYNKWKDKNRNDKT